MNLFFHITYLSFRNVIIKWMYSSLYAGALRSLLAAPTAASDVSKGAERSRDGSPTIDSGAKDCALVQQRRAILTPQSHGVLFRSCIRDRHRQ